MIKSIIQFLQEKKLSGIFIPKTDRFQNEYIPIYEDRVFQISGFDGSFGQLIITPQKSALFVDGRYLTQAKQQVDTTFFDVFLTSEVSPQQWWKNTQKGTPIAIDPWLITKTQADSWQKKGIHLAFLTDHSFDALINLPKRSTWNTAWVYPKTYAGASFKEKYQKIITSFGTDETFLLCDSPSINWLLNIRGGDIPYNPLLNGYVLIHQKGEVQLFTEVSQISQSCLDRFEGDVSVHPLETIFSALENTDKTICYDPSQTPMALIGSIQNKKKSTNPCMLPKACKNKSEQEFFKSVHVKDAISLCEFFAWLDEASAKRSISELEIVDQVFSCRQKQEGFVDLSFATIAAFDENAAIVHYHPCEKTEKKSHDNSLLLLDSGGHYLGGTTDITRTVSLGTPILEQQQCYTRVLKGHIALARCVFPRGTSGGQLDVLARQFLWEVGLDYLHGTGHGVGNCLTVHEGPQRIGKKESSHPLFPGMIVSNEPGYYKEGAFGIRLENLVLVVERPDIGQDWMGFETLSLVPFDPKLILWEDLLPFEQEWLKEYTKKIQTLIEPCLSPYSKKWLQKVCQLQS